jgi:hypothetical protein
MAGFQLSINGRFWVSTEGRPGLESGRFDEAHRADPTQKGDHSFARRKKEMNPNPLWGAFENRAGEEISDQAGISLPPKSGERRI